MSLFDQRWQRLVTAARRAPSLPLPSPPLHRVRAWMSGAAISGSSASDAAGDLWLRYGVRGLATATLVLLVSVWFAFGGLRRERDRDAAPLRPGIENAVAEVFWLL